MRILVCTPEFATGYGIGYATWQEAEHLSKRGHQVSVLTTSIPSQHEPSAKISLHKITVRKTPFVDLLMFWLALRSWVRGIPQKAYDVLYINGPTFGLLPFHAMEIPVVYFARSTVLGRRRALLGVPFGTDLRQRIVDSYLYKLEKTVLCCASRIVTKSARMKKELQVLYYVSTEKISTITGGINPGDFFPAQYPESRLWLRRKLLISDKKRILLYAGRIVPVKGVDILLEVFSELVKHDNSYVLVFAGKFQSKRYESYFHKHAKKLELRAGEDFYLVGHYPFDQMNNLFHGADVTIMPSRYEPFGMVALQSLYSGTPVVASSVLGSSEIAGPENGFFTFEPNGKEGLLFAIRQAIRRNAKPPLVGTWEQVAMELEKVFAAVAK